MRGLKVDIDINLLELKFVGKQYHEIKREYGKPESIKMIMNNHMRVEKKYIYKDFVAQIRNDICIRITERIESS